MMKEMMMVVMMMTMMTMMAMMTMMGHVGRSGKAGWVLTSKIVPESQRFVPTLPTAWI